MQFKIYSKTKKDNRESNKQVKFLDDYALLIVERAVLVINLNSFS